jgi:hypothetical protein
VLDHPFFHWAWPSNEEVRRNIPSHSQIRTQQLCRVSPQGFLSTNAIFKTPYPDTVIFYIDVLNRQRGRFVYSQAIVINESE